MAVSKSPEKPKVLVVYNNKVILDTLMIILRQCGFDAAPAYTGEEAIEIAKTFRPDVLLTDVVMPGMNGIEAAIAIRGFLPRCYIIGTSGSIGGWDLLRKAQDEGHDIDIVATPFHPQEFLLKISELFPNFVPNPPLPPIRSEPQKPVPTGKSSVPPRTRLISAIRRGVAAFFSR